MVEPNQEGPKDPKAEKFLTGKYADVPRLDKPSRRWVWVTLAAVLVLALATGAYLLFFKDKATAPPSQEQKQTGQAVMPKTSLRLLATGDWIAHDAINQEAEQADGSYSYDAMLEPFKSQFAGSDVNFCNQATPAGGASFGVSGYPVFNAPFEWLGAMKSLGCNLINTGTNHTNDKGQRVIDANLDQWDELGMLAVAGAGRDTEEMNKVRYFEKDGVKFAFVSYSTYSNLPNPNPYSLSRFEEPLVTNQMTEARANADIVIVSMRWGTEYSDAVNEAQKTQAQKLADLGADIVLGHGTHTLQAVDKLTGLDGRETVVWYGLGNFLNAQLETGGLTGCVADMQIDIATKKIISNMCLPFYQHYEWTAEEKAREDLLARKNFLIMPLYNAAEWMAKSQLGTTVEEQMERVRAAVNVYTEVPVENASDL